VPPLLAGHLDVSLTTPDSIIPANDKELQTVAVMVLDASHGGDGIVAKPGIKTVADLKGKRIAVTEGEVNHLLLMLALEKAGLSGKDVQLTNMNADDAGAAFIAGRLDAAVTWEPWLSNARSQGAGNILFTSADAPGMLIDVAVVTPKTLSARRAELAAFARAVDRGLMELRKNPQASNALAGKWLGIAGDEVAGMLEGIRLYGAKENAQLFGGEIGQSFVKIQQFLVSQGRTAGKASAKEMVDGRIFAD
jgi:NitT/TauT family transport system substrate-binding protein